MCVIGRSGSGKTTNLCKMLNKPEFWPDDVERIFWTNPQGLKTNHDKCVETLIANNKKVELIDFDTAASRSENADWPPKSIVIFDDIREQVVKRDEGLVMQLTANSNHQHLISIVIVQNLFTNNFKPLREQCRYIVFSRFLLDQMNLKMFLRRTVNSDDMVSSIICDLYNNHFRIDELQIKDEPCLFVIDIYNRGTTTWVFYNDSIFAADLNVKQLKTRYNA